MKPRLSALLFILALILPADLFAAEYTNGAIKVVLHESTGRFSLYYRTASQYEAFFVDEDPRTSFLSVIVDDKTYRLGETSAFRVRSGGTPDNPALIFESSFLRVHAEFAFIRTSGSPAANGVKLSVRVENTGTRESRIGLRLLIDTSLGEGKNLVPFTTDRRQILSETALDKNAADLFWVSRNDRLALMGSLAAGSDTPPDLVHFANWKRLNEVPWKIPNNPERNFNYLPYSINDSAVCYYFEPSPAARGSSRVYSLLLAAEDPRGFTAWQPVSGNIAIAEITGDTPAPAYDKEADLALLDELISRLDKYIAGDLAFSDDEVGAIEAAINRLRVRYGLP